MRRVSKLFVLLIGVILVMTSARGAFADDETEFEKARNPYTAGRYAEAVERFRELLEPSSDKRLTDPWLIERSRMYLVASLIATNHIKEADEQIKVILRQNPSAVPDAVFPTQVLDRFTDVRARMREELEEKAREEARAEQEKLRQEQEKKARERARIKELERLASQEVHVEAHSRWIAMIPFGVGQFQNDQRALGWTLLGSEAALAGTSIVASVVVQSLQSQGTKPTVDKQNLNDRTSRWEQVNHLSFIACVVAAAGGVLHAQLTYVPERREVVRRPLPPSLQVVPSAAAIDKGAVVGIQGSF